MSHRSIALLLVVGTAAALVWRHELYTVQRPGELPRDLVAIAAARRQAADFDAVLPAVPIGMRRLRVLEGATLIYYWAPWQEGAYAQASTLDSLRRQPGLDNVRIEVVCFDPFPSVARYIARRRLLSLPVLLDTRGDLRSRLPCPSIPYTYLLDASGRIAIAQAGRVEWLSAKTRKALERVAREPREHRREPGESTMLKTNDSARGRRVTGTCAGQALPQTIWGDASLALAVDCSHGRHPRNPARLL